MTRPEPSLVPYINPSSITNLGEGRVYGLPLSRSNKPELHWSHIIHAEIASVIATMRENDNWSFSNAIDYRRPYSPELQQQQQQQQLQQLQELQHNQQQHQQQPLSNTRDEIMNLTLRSATQHYNYGANLVSMSKGVGLDPVLEYNSAHSDSYFFAQESPLLLGFTRLKARLTLINDLRDLEPIHLLSPFIEVVRSKESNGFMTASAIKSIEKFIQYRVLDPNHPTLPIALSALSHVLSNCKFNGSGASLNEAVLSKILQLISTIVTSEAGQKSLDDTAICELIETTFGMCIKGSSSDMLKRTSEQTLIVIVQILFERLTLIMRAKEQRERVREVELQSENTRRLKRNQNNMNSEKNLLGSFSRKSTDLKDLIHADLSDSMTTSTTRDTDSITSNSADRRQEPESYHIEPSPFIKNESQIVDGLDLATAMNGGGADSAPRPVSSPSRPKFSSEFMSQSSHPLLPKASYVQLETFEPFGLPSIVEIIKVSTSLMNPRNRQYVDNVHRRLGLTLMITAMEVGGQSLNKWIDWGIAVEEKKRESYHDRRTSLIPTNLEGAVDMIAKGREKSARKDVHVEIPQVNEQDFALPKPQHLQQQQQQDETDLASLNGGVGGTMTSTNSTVVNDDGTSSINNLSDEKQLLLNGDTHPEHTGSPSSATSETIHVNGDSRKEKSPTDINAVESVKSPQQQQEQPAEALTDSMFQSQEDSHEERMAIKAKEYITNEMCKHLFQILQMSNITSTSPPSAMTVHIVGMTLKLISSIFHSCRENMWLQLEWILEWIMSKVDMGLVVWDIEEGQIGESRPSDGALEATAPSLQSNQQKQGFVVGEVREHLLDCLLQLVRIPSFMIDIYVHFDGDLKCQSHLYEKLVRFLSKHSLPDATLGGGPATSSSHQSQCLDALLVLLHQIPGKSSELLSTQQKDAHKKAAGLVSTSKKQKRVLMQGIEKFNEDPKDGIAFLQSNKFLPTPCDPKSLAHLFKFTPQIKKNVLGQFFAKKNNEDVLRAFLLYFDFKGKRLDEALRLMLESFRLPGEAQQIDRIVEIFAETFFGNRDPMEEVRSKDAAYVLAFSIIMLNTDLHSPQVRKKMTLEAFQRNNRGINDGQNFSPEYLNAIYDEIKNNEIILPEEHEGDLGFNYAWRELLKRSYMRKSKSSKFLTSSVYEEDMFMHVWWTVLAAVSYSFSNSEDGLTHQKAMAGLSRCAAIAAHYNQTEVFDHIFESLSRITQLKEYSPIDNETRKRQSNNLANKKLDKWVVDFGKNYRRRIAAVLMFCLASQYGGYMRSGWKDVIECTQNLFLHSLLPQSMLETDDFVKGTIVIPIIPVPELPSSKNEEVSGPGFFSTFAQLFSGGADPEYYEPHPEDLEAEGVAFECIRFCHIEDIFMDSKFSEESALKLLVQAVIKCSKASVLRESLHKSGSSDNLPPPIPISSRSASPDGKGEDRYARSMHPMSKSDSVAQHPQTDGGKIPSGLDINTAAVFLFEVLVKIAIQNRDRIHVIWTPLSEYIHELLNEASTCHIMLLQRVVVGLFRLMLRLMHNDEVTGAIFGCLQKLKNLPSDIFQNVSENLMAGLFALVKSDWYTISQGPRGDIVMYFLTATCALPEASKFAFEITMFLLQDTSQKGAINSENFGDFVDLLISFTAESTGVLHNMADRQIYQQISSTVLYDTDQVPSAGGAVASPNRPDGSAIPAKGGRSIAVQAMVDRAVRSLENLFKLHITIPPLIEQIGIKTERAWFEYWLPILAGLSQQCYHPFREVRHHSLTYLQRALLLPELAATTLDCATDCFDNVIFPLLDELLKPEVCRLDSIGMEETRMRATGLLSKTFLHYFPSLFKKRDFLRLWGRILNYINRYMKVAESEYLYEAIQESLKNMLLVMSTQDVFKAKFPINNNNTEVSLWDFTWQQVDSYLPTLREELFPTPTPPPPSTASPQTTAAPTGEPT